MLPPSAVPATAAAAALAQDPAAHRRAYARRPDAQLPFDMAAYPPDLPVLLDTNVYILRLQQRLPVGIIDFVGSRRVLHCGVALAEMAISAGILDPAHPETGRSRGALLRLLENISLSDCRAPSPAAWAEAGMLSGILARLQLGLARSRKTLTSVEACCQTGRRREVLNDALLFLTAREQGAVFVSANIADMDLLLRFRPDARLLLFRPSDASTRTGPAPAAPP